MIPPEETHTERLCRKVYQDTRDFYRDRFIPGLGGSRKSADCGFKILYGPPVVNPPILFLGYQPGGSRTDAEREPDSEHDWPKECQYATANWHIAKKMRKVFRVELLETCVGLNAIFMRSPNIAEYRRNVPTVLRDEIRMFCLERVIKVIEAIRPKAIVAIGFATLALFDSTNTADLMSKPLSPTDQRRVLVKRGSIAGRSVLATLHLSGAHISKADLNLIKKHILAAVEHSHIPESSVSR